MAKAVSILGVLPAVGSGLDTMARAGQLGRLDRYARAWDGAFGHATYFSYLPWETEREHTSILQSGGDWAINAWGGPWSIRRAFLRPLRQPEHWRGLTVLRCLNLLAAVPALCARLRWGIPFVVSHGANYEEIARIHGDHGQIKKWRWLRRVAFRLAAAVIVPSEPMAHRLQYRFPKARIVHIPNWVDTEMFRPFGHSDGKVAIYTGRLVAEKNLVRVARALRRTGWTFQCIGEGPERAALEAEGATCIGVASWESLPSLLNGASLFVLPSLSEGHPKALLEAMACGLACAVSDRVEGIIRNGGNGLVFGAEDEASMERIFDLVANPIVRDVLGRAARYDVLVRYDIKNVLPSEVALLRECAS